MRKQTEQLKVLSEALLREKGAAKNVVLALEQMKTATETLDAAGHRRTMTEAREAFEELTRCAAERFSLSTKLGASVGLKREDRLPAILASVGRGTDGVRALAGELSEELSRVSAGISVMALLTRYGSAMTANLMEIRGAGRVAVPYGKNGHRTASTTRSGRLA